MFCPKCGNELKYADLFCSKCGTSIRKDSESTPTVGLPPEKRADTKGKAVTTEKRSGKVEVRGKLPSKRIVRLSPQKKRPLALVVNGECRYCGRRLSESAEVCPECGARSKAPTVLDVKRAAEIGKGLGGESLENTLVGGSGFGFGFDDWFGCILAPLILINPLFWCKWVYKLKAEAALEKGALDFAQEYKSTSTKFAVAGWIVTVVAILIGCVWLSKKSNF